MVSDQQGGLIFFLLENGKKEFFFVFFWKGKVGEKGFMPGILLSDADEPETFLSRFTLPCLSQMLLTCILGFGLGIVLSSTLYLLVTNSFFAVLISVALICFGLLVLLTTQSNSSSHAPLMKIIVLSGAGATVVGGLCGLVLQFARPSLSFLLLWCCACFAISSCFALLLTYTEFYNYWISQQMLVAQQVYSIAISSITIGAATSFLFLLVDVEDHVARFGYEQWVTAGISGAIGALIGFVNHNVKGDDMNITFDPLPMEDAGTPHHPEDSTE